MKFSTVLAAGFAAVSQAITVSYDTGYDDAGRSLTAVSCSDGQNGLMTKYGWQNQGQVAGFPHVGGFEGIGGWNSPQCGTCYSVTYNGKTINVLAIDHAASGFNLALAAMNELTNGHAQEFGRVDAQYQQVAGTACGLPA